MVFVSTFWSRVHPESFRGWWAHPKPEIEISPAFLFSNFIFHPTELDTIIIKHTVRYLYFYTLKTGHDM